MSKEISFDMSIPNELLRSCYAVAKRKGRDTNWEYLEKALFAELEREHEIMHKEYHDRFCLGQEEGSNGK